MAEPEPKIQSVAVIGAGIIGLSCALELADRGVRVSIYEQNWPPRGASWAAAGMLAPAFEAASQPGTHPDLFALCDAGARLWEDWSARLETRTGLPSGYQPGPSLAIARTPEQDQKLRAVHSAMKCHSLAPTACLGRVAEIEPAITPDLVSAYLLPSDGQADNRQTLNALIACAETHEQITVHTFAAPLAYSGGLLDHAGHDATLVTAGWQSARIEIVGGHGAATFKDIDPALDRLKVFGGQMLALAATPGAPNMTVRCGDLYIVPKSDRIIVGATTEPGRALTKPDIAVIESLRARAIEICPGLEDTEVIESWAGIRPGTADHAPILGRTRVPGLFVATGHYRNGILLAPITAQIMTDLIIDGRNSDLGRSFSPDQHLAEQL